MNRAKPSNADDSETTAKVTKQTKQVEKEGRRYNTRSKQAAEQNVKAKNTQAAEHNVERKITQATSKKHMEKAVELNAVKEAEQNKTIESKNNELLQQLVQLLTLKIQADESQQKNTKIAAESFEKIIPEFDGGNMPVKQWFANFELNADAYGLNNVQKYVQARAIMTKTAKLFLESVSVYEYGAMRTMLEDEFDNSKICSADVHVDLRERKQQKHESFHEYVL